jgi:DNA mismatch repair protein MutS
MGFITDSQTLEDLKILGKRGEDSVLGMFDRTHTRGGAALLEEMFHYPLSEVTAIHHRSSIIRHFAAAGTVFPFESELFDIADVYLAGADERTKLSKDDQTLGSRFNHLIGADTEYMNIYKGVTSVIKIMQVLRDFMDADRDFETHGLDAHGPDAHRPAGHVPAEGSAGSAGSRATRALLAETALEPLWQERPNAKLPFAKVADYDLLLRFRHRDTIRKILRYIYHLDVYLSVAKVAAERKFAFAEVMPGNRHTLVAEGIYHPFLKRPVPNTLQMMADSNVLFLTGANMAGKSTFMKALGIALFLAHMGFPVPAAKMTFPVLDGMYTTINLPDNLGMGASHFYAEVLRVKKVARELSLSKNLFIIFDELFRGTNVKDAYEATVAITAAFAQKQGSMFVISTHIMEAGEVLKERCGNIGFQYLPTHMNGNTPVYTYTLETGITDDRHGMVIINNEGILDILERGRPKHKKIET